MFSQDAEVGVKCTCHSGRLANQARIAGVVDQNELLGLDRPPRHTAHREVSVLSQDHTGEYREAHHGCGYTDSVEHHTLFDMRPTSE